MKQNVEMLSCGFSLECALDGIKKEVLSNKGIAEVMEELSVYSRQTYEHCNNVSRRASIVGLLSDLENKDVIEFATAGMLVDVGYLDIPEEYIKRPTFLYDEEFKKIKCHVVCSAHIAESLGCSPDVIDMIMSHHERADGSGYPGRKILRDKSYKARMIAVCDCFEALMEPRPYRRLYNQREALDILYHQAERDFDMESLLTLSKTLLFE